jgi:hypothetical protein
LKSYNVVPLIASTIAETPLVSNKVLCQILEPYGKPYCFTDAVLQKARVTARRLISGNPDENDGYAPFLKEDLEKSGHHVILSFTTRKEIMQNLDKIIISDKILRRKEAKVEGLAQADKVHFVKQWKEDHRNQLP